MDTATLDKLQDLLAKNDEVAIAVGKNPSVDDMGAALSLYLSCKAQGKKATIAGETEPIVELSSLVGIDKVKSFFSGQGGDLVVSFPYNEGEIEKVSYTLENGSLNIIVKAGALGLSFEEKDVQYKRGNTTPSLLFIVGTPRLSDLGNLFDPQTLKDTTIVNIDNKIENQGFGDVVIVSTNASSVSEQVANLLSALRFPLDIDVAQNLISGISFATENFQSPKTSAIAFEMAGFLLKKGAVRQKSVRRQVPNADNAFFSQMGGQQNVQAQRQPALRDQYTNPRDQQRDKSGFRPRVQMPFPRQQQPSMQPRTVSSTQSTEEAKDNKPDEAAPPDWLTPKVYKGSTLV